jgi:hypothetical protein
LPRSFRARLNRSGRVSFQEELAAPRLTIRLLNQLG